jgi:hypothetical protein
MAHRQRLVTIALQVLGPFVLARTPLSMKRLIFALALAGFACAASAHLADAGDSATSFSEQGAPVAAAQAYAGGARSFSELLADASSNTSRTEPRVTAVTSAVPEPQTYALLLAGLGAIIFVAIRRRRP